MAVEASDVAVDLVVAVDPVPADEVLITIDPIELMPLPVDDLGEVPPDAQTFGEPVDIFIDVPSDKAADVPADGGDSDGGAGDPPADEDLMFTTTVVDDAPVDAIPVEDGVVEDGVPADGGDDGTVYTMEDSGTLVERPSDPEPNWRTLDGEGGGGEGIGAEGGSGDTGSDPVFDVGIDPVFDVGVDPVVDEVLDKDAVADGETPADDGSEIPDDVIYTLDPNDPLIYANTASGEAPGRSIDPLPYERTNSAPAVDPAAPDTASDVVHYAAAEPFHTGLDLL